MPALPWIRYQNPGGFTIEHPPGWAVQPPEMAGTGMIANADWSQVAFVEQLPATTVGPVADILRHGRFSATVFHQSTPDVVQEGPSVASYLANFQFKDGRTMRGRVRCRAVEGGYAIIAVAAVADVYPHIEPMLERILQSYKRLSPAGVASPPPPPPPQQARPAATLAYATFSDPVAGTFTVDVPKGWRVRGGLHHPGLGDRRLWVEAQSQDGIVILSGDPNCPQCFCHYPMTPQDVMVPSAQGCTYLNIAPSAKKLTDYYLKHVAAKGLGELKMAGQRERNDLAAQEIQLVKAQGIPVAKAIKVSVLETQFEAQGRVGRCYASCWNDPATSLGFMTLWTGALLVWLAPAGLEGVAEQVVDRMRTSFRVTQKLYQVVQQDENMIASNGMSANMNQQMWFQGQQAVHNAQMAQGDAIVQNYWQQQRVNDGMNQSYWNAQRVNDRASDQWSDAMLDKQRLYDDNLGKAYETPGGHNYYWLDQQSGKVVGTDTSDPPDYSNSYTQLRKL